jgi:hypothetical protein
MGDRHSAAIIENATYGDAAHWGDSSHHHGDGGSYHDGGGGYGW